MSGWNRPLVSCGYTGLSLPGGVLMLSGSAMAGSRGSKVSMWGFESRPGIYHLRDLKQNTSVLCSSVSSSIKKYIHIYVFSKDKNISIYCKSREAIVRIK